MERICKVLIVENDDHVRDLLANVVRLEGYLFTTVESGHQMRAALDEDDYDIAIIDITLPPPEDGFALARVAREQGCGVILMTGNPYNLERLQGSGEHFLLKPFGVNF